jgi:excisionase family DNA binding protein
MSPRSRLRRAAPRSRRLPADMRAAARSAAPVVTRPRKGPPSVDEAQSRWKGSARTYVGRGERIRTSGILLPKTEDEIAGGGKGLQPSINTDDRETSQSSCSLRLGANSKDFAPILLPEKAPPREDRHVGVPRSALLSVADVAHRLRVCEATVYKLCARGALAHIRVLNAVRIAPEAVDAFAQRR